MFDKFMGIKIPTCFVICPIGEDGSKERIHANLTLRYVIEPIVKPLGYDDIERSDLMPNPGMITGQIIDKLLTSDLVIADLSFYNPNVFYELAIRHMTDLPFIQMMSPIGSRIPFDVKDMRTIYFGTDLESCEIGKASLLNHMNEIVENSKKVIDNPIRQALNGKRLREWVSRQVEIGTTGDFNKAVLEGLMGLNEEIRNMKSSLASISMNNPSLAENEAMKLNNALYELKASMITIKNDLLNIENEQTEILGELRTLVQEPERNKAIMDRLQIELDNLTRRRRALNERLKYVEAEAENIRNRQINRS